MKIGVIGFGSIGKRHCENLLQLGISEIVLLRKNSSGNTLHLKEIYDEEDFFKHSFNAIILSNPTALHFEYLKILIKNNYNLLVEKPIVAFRHEANEIEQILKSYTGLGMCAYNLRFHPCIQKVQDLISENKIGKIYNARFFIGQYLPDWRPNADYSNSYSAKKTMGGGVVLDLIHEIDLALLLCGDVRKGFSSIIDRVSNLEIDTEDIAEIIYQSENNIVVNIHMDYLYRGYSRYFELIGELGRIYCDLFKAEINITFNNEIKEKHVFNEFVRNDMYLNLMKYFISSIRDKQQPFPSLSDGLKSLHIALRAKNE